MAAGTRAAPVDAYLCLDQGGHASRALTVAADDGRIIDTVEAPVKMRAGADTSEQDPQALLESMRAVIRSASGRAGIRLLAAGMATQRSPIVCWRRGSGEPVSPVLGWQDRRAAHLLPAAPAIRREINRRTGLVANAHYGATKMRWCLEHLEPVRRAYAEGDLVAGPLAAFLAHKLTGTGPAVDRVNASRTMLLNRDKHVWDGRLLDLFGIPVSILPEVLPAAADYGRLAGSGPPLRLLTGDQGAVPFAFGHPDTEVLYLNMGTGAFLQRVLDPGREAAPPLLESPLPGHPERALEGTVNGAGSALDAYAGGDDWRGSLDLVPGLPVDAPLYLNGIGGLGSPDWRADFASRFIGDGCRAVCTAAVAESILFLIRRNLDAMHRQLPPPNVIQATGGLAASDALCQSLADLTGIMVLRPAALEATALGVATLLGAPAQAADGIGSRAFTPGRKPLINRRYQSWNRELEDALSA